MSLSSAISTLGSGKFGYDIQTEHNPNKEPEAPRFASYPISIKDIDKALVLKALHDNAETKGTEAPVPVRILLRLITKKITVEQCRQEIKHRGSNNLSFDYFQNKPIKTDISENMMDIRDYIEMNGSNAGEELRKALESLQAPPVTPKVPITNEARSPLPRGESSTYPQGDTSETAITSGSESRDEFDNFIANYIESTNPKTPTEPFDIDKWLDEDSEPPKEELKVSGALAYALGIDNSASAAEGKTSASDVPPGVQRMAEDTLAFMLLSESATESQSERPVPELDTSASDLTTAMGQHTLSDKDSTDEENEDTA